MDQNSDISLDGAEARLWTSVARSHSEYLRLTSNYGCLLSKRRSLEHQLEEMLSVDASASLVGLCSACECYRPLVYDHLYASSNTVNWRERLVCPFCNLNNRLRLSLHLLQLRTSSQDSIYLTEALTPFASLLEQRRPNIVLSEFLGEGFRSGQIRSGIRHEDVTCLSFNAECFDHVLSFDVLEHVPNYNAALKEFWRVLRPGGTLMLSVPFVLSSCDTLQRARITSEGAVEHILPPEYHGDPVGNGRGILCFYHFGWDLLGALSAVGFHSAEVQLYWSLGHGYIGPEQIIITASKG